MVLLQAVHIQAHVFIPQLALQLLHVAPEAGACRGRASVAGGEQVRQHLGMA